MMLVGSVLLMSSCGTYTGEGAYAGATFGSILGSAIGGISGGWRGSDVGTVIGMAGGAAVGAAIGAAADQKQAERVEEYHRQRANRTYEGIAVMMLRIAAMTGLTSTVQVLVTVRALIQVLLRESQVWSRAIA